MKHPKSLLLPRAILASFVPFIIAGTFYALLSIIVGLKAFFFNHESSNANPQGSYSSLEKIENIFEQISMMSLSVYQSYFHFMIVVGILNLTWKILTSPRTMNPPSKASIFPQLQRVIAKFISFSLIYLLLSQIKIFTSQSDLFKSSNLVQEFSFPRILSQQDDSKMTISTPSLPSEKLSLSIGRTLSSLELDVSSFIISNNGKYVFALTRNHGILKVIDISSDLEDPFITASLEFDIKFWYFGQKNLILSSDGNTLYISDFKNLQIVNVTDPLLPNALGFYQEKNLPDDPTFYRLAPGRPLVTLALSKDNKKLFVGGFGLQIFDVSMPKNPLEVIYRDIHTCDKEKCMNITTIALSEDGQNLFIANGTLDIYQISTGKVISSYESQNIITSIFLSDEKTAFLAGTNMTIEKIDISDLQAPKRLSFTSFPPLETTLRPAFIVANSPNKTQLYILVDIDAVKYLYFGGLNVLVYDITKDSLINDEQTLLPYAHSLKISADGRKVFATTNSRFKILELFLDYPNKRIMSLSQETLGFFKTEYFWMKTIPSIEKNIVFVRAKNRISDEDSFEVWNLTKGFSPTRIASYKPQEELTFNCPITMTADYTKAFLLSMDKKLTALDLTDLANPIPYATYTFDEDVTSIRSLRVSKNGHRVFAEVQEENYSSLVILDFSDPSSIEKISTIQTFERSGDNDFNALFLDKDEKTVFIVHQSIVIYDVSDPSHPKLLNSLPVARDEPLVYFDSACLSSDSKTLFVQFHGLDFARKLHIFNVTDPTSVTLISQTPLPMYDVAYFTPFQITPDAKTGYVFQRAFMLVLSLEDLAAPSISGVVSLIGGSSTGVPTDFSLSFDGKTGIVYNKEQEAWILDLELKKTLFINQEIFPLGEKYSDRVQMLGINNLGTWGPLTLSHATLKMNFCCPPTLKCFSEYQ